MEPMVLAAAGSTVALATHFISGVLPRRGPHEWFAQRDRHNVRKRKSSGLIGPRITFDDGPHPVWTPLILDALRTHDVRATFFVVGENVRRYPELLQRIHDEGHHVGNHAYHHRSMLFLRAAIIRSSILRCQQEIFDVLGFYPTEVRPPYGHRDFRFYRVASELCLRPTFWTFDSGDWRIKDFRRLQQRLRRVATDDIVLMHDGRPDCLPIINALPSLLCRLRGDIGDPEIESKVRS